MPFSRSAGLKSFLPTAAMHVHTSLFKHDRNIKGNQMLEELEGDLQETISSPRCVCVCVGPPHRGDLHQEGLVHGSEVNLDTKQLALMLRTNLSALSGR